MGAVIYGVCMQDCHQNKFEKQKLPRAITIHIGNKIQYFRCREIENIAFMRPLFLYGLSLDLHHLHYEGYGHYQAI